MVGRFDYNNDDVMNILNNPGYTEDQKKALYEKYKDDLKDVRRKEIISRLNECAKNNPIITQEEYVGFLKKYNDDDLSRPFEMIEQDLENFKNKMQEKYDLYLKQKAEAETVIPTPAPIPEPVPQTVQERVEEDFDIADEIKPDVTPINYNTFDDSSVDINNETIETPDINLNPTVFEETPVKEVMPEEMPDSLNEKGNASAIIISIIAIIIGMIIMYSIIKLK